MNIKFLILLILLIILKTYDFSHKIEIIVQKNNFYLDNEEQVDIVVKNIINNCRTREKIKLNLKFDFMHPQLQVINPYENGRISIFKNETWVELNSQFWMSNSRYDQQVLLYHEIGHSLGLNHNNTKENVMNEKSQKTVNLNKFYRELKVYCSSMTKIPSSQY